MARGARSATGRLGLAVGCGLAALGLVGCGSGVRSGTAGTSSTPSVSTTTVTTTATATTTTTATVTLPGVGKPPVTIGDENVPEQFLLGQLYYQALKAQGFQVQLNQSIGPPQVVMQALATGQLAMYPEYLDNWNQDVAGLKTQFHSRAAAYVAGERYRSE